MMLYQVKTESEGTNNETVVEQCMTDKQILKTVYLLVTFVGLAVFACMTIDKSSQASALYTQTQKQQNKIDKQQREISRLEQTNKALANQAKGRY